MLKPFLVSTKFTATSEVFNTWPFVIAPALCLAIDIDQSA